MIDVKKSKKEIKKQIDEITNNDSVLTSFFMSNIYYDNDDYNRNKWSIHL